MNITILEMAQATIEIFGGLICIMLAVIIIINGYKRDSWKHLKWMFFSMSLILFSEAAAYIFRGNTDTFSILMNRGGNFVVFFLNIIMINLFLLCMYDLFGERGKTPSTIYKKLVWICSTISFLILVMNFFTGWMYYFDQANDYHRNTGWYVYTLFNLICIIIGFAMCIRYRKAVRIGMLAALLIYALAPIISIVLQMLIYGISITNIGVFAALVLMFLVYLREWSRTRERKDKERRKFDLVVLFIIMTISMGAFLFFSLISIHRIATRNSENNSMLIAQMVKDSVENEVLKPIIVSETMANDYSLKEYMKKSSDDSPESVQNEVASYLDSIRNGFGYPMVYVVCDASKAYYTCDGICEFIDVEKHEQDAWYKRFVEEGKHYDLEVDTDVVNHWDLSVFVNTEITDENGNYLGVCGVGIEMTTLQDFIKRYEEKYDVKINLMDREGMIQIDSDIERIRRDRLDNSYLDNVGSGDFYYEKGDESSRMTKYLETLDWYLVVEDCNPEKISVIELTTTSIIIFLIAFMMMGIVFTVIMIREKKTSKELRERREISITDDMTGLFNRRAYEEDCLKIQETDLVSRMTLIMMDLNGLKSVNDTYGHMAGDELIIAAAKCVQTSMGKYGKVYRIGGDEFMAFMECNSDQLHDMIHTFEHVVNSWKGTYPCKLSISKGVVVCKEHEKLTFEEIKELADKLMYEDKNKHYESEAMCKQT